MTAASALALSAAGARVLLIATATHQGPTLTSVPAARRSAEALAIRLTERCGVPPERLRVLIDPPTAQDLATAIAEEAGRAESTLLVYFIGHGLIGPGDELHLAASATDRLTPGLEAYEALPLTALRQAVTACRASSVIAILDCCFSGRAELAARQRRPALNLPPANGIYLLASADQLALAPENAQHTTFTGELITLLDRGDPLGPRLLTLDDIYKYLLRTLGARGAPPPRAQAGDRSGDLVITANSAAPAPAEDAPPPPEPDNTPCPYRGLEPFAEDDARLFHGRDQLTAELLTACARAVALGHPVIVVGPSGAGKTSLLRAGLLAALQRGATEELPGSPGWPQIVLSPGEHPMRALAAGLHPEGVAGSEALSRDPASAAALAGKLVAEETSGPGRAVLVCDQLEELFTLCRGAAQREAFGLALTALAKAGSLVVLALRADFYGQAQGLAALEAALRDHQVSAGPMREEELRAAIEEPAALAGLELEDGLVGLLLSDVGAAYPAHSRTGVLPLLSHALWATWRERRGGRLTIAGYVGSGGIDGAIAHTADATYQQLDEDGRLAVRHLLPRLVRLDDETVDTARPADRATLLNGLPDPPAAERALHRLAAARLVVLDRQTVRISHEALLRSWPKLREWVDADRVWLRARQQLAADAQAWWAAKQDNSLLYRGSRLADAREQAEGVGPRRLDPRSAEFLAQSVRQERRTTRIRRAFIAGICCLALLAAIGGGVAWVYQRQAADQRNHAVARLVAAEAESLRGSRPGLAKQLSMIAYRLDHKAGAEQLFAGAETPGVFDAEDPAADIALNAAGTTLAISTGGDVALWDTGGGGLLSRVAVTKSASVGLSPDGRLLAVTDAEGGGARLKLWQVGNPRTPQGIRLPPGEGSGITSLAFGPDGRTLALGGSSGGIRLWDVSRPGAPRPLRTLTGVKGAIDSLVFAHSGEVLAAVGEDGTVGLWDPRDAARTSPLSTFAGEKTGTDLAKAHRPVHRLAFSPDGKLLAGPGKRTEGGIRLWDVHDHTRPQAIGGEEKPAVDSCPSELISVSFSPDGKGLAAGCGRDTILWSLRPGGRLSPAQVLAGASGSATTPMGPTLFAPRGHRLLTATPDGVYIRYAENQGRLGAASSFGPAPSGFHSTAAFSGGPRRLFAVQGAGNGVLWDLTGSLPHRLLAMLPGSGTITSEALAFGPGGRILALSEKEGGKDQNDEGGRRVVRLRDTGRDGAPAIATITDIANGVESLSFSPDGRVLAVADSSDFVPGRTAPPAVRLFDVSTPSRPRPLGSPLKGNVYNVAFAPQGHLLTATTDNTLLAWDMSDPRHPGPQQTLRLSPGAGISYPAFRPDGRWLAVTDNVDTTRLWPVKGDRIDDTPDARVTMRTIGSGQGIAFSPDGRTLAWQSNGQISSHFGSVNSHIELWDVGNPRRPAHRASFAYGRSVFGTGSLSYSAQGRLPLLAAVGETVDVWVTSPDVEAAFECDSVGDVITKDEWRTYVPDTPYDPPCHS